MNIPILAILVIFINVLVIAFFILSIMIKHIESLESINNNIDNYIQKNKKKEYILKPTGILGILFLILRFNIGLGIFSIVVSSLYIYYLWLGVTGFIKISNISSMTLTASSTFYKKVKNNFNPLMIILLIISFFIQIGIITLFMRGGVDGDGMYTMMGDVIIAAKVSIVLTVISGSGLEYISNRLAISSIKSNKIYLSESESKVGAQNEFFDKSSSTFN